MAELASIDHQFNAPSSSVHRIQEAQTTIYNVPWELTLAAWGASIRLSRCSELVFVDQPAEPVPATNALCCRKRWRTHGARARRSKVATAMRPGVVVVLDVLSDNADEVPFATDQEPVQALGAFAEHCACRESRPQL